MYSALVFQEVRKWKNIFLFIWRFSLKEEWMKMYILLSENFCKWEQ